jgi:anti-sigma regulatory factor (Ser/Thr protein kinase)
VKLKRPQIALAGGGHAVHFYEREAELARTVAGYLADGLRAGGVAVLIAAEAHRAAFDAELAVVGVDATRARRDGGLVWLDAARTLAAVTARDRVDGPAFDRVVGNELRCAARTGAPLRAYGEMVALLWEAGNVLAAIELEKLWNDLLPRTGFSLLCAYHSESVSRAERAGALREVCLLHSMVLPRRAEFSADFPALSGAPCTARRMLADALRQWGLDERVTADAELVMSELASNAVVHARSPFTVLARCGPARLKIAVRDSSVAQPAIREISELAPSGRGLRIVDMLARDWGVEPSADGKTVWAEIALEA